VRNARRDGVDYRAILQVFDLDHAMRVSAFQILGGIHR
jgi:hypothetical protein